MTIPFLLNQKHAFDRYPFKIISIAALLFTAIAFILTIANRSPYSVNLTQDEVQSKISSALPLHIQKPLTDIVVNTLDLQFEAQEIALYAQLDISLAGVKTTGTARATSQIKYDNGNFYLHKFKVVDFALHPVDEAKTSMLTRAAERLVDGVKNKVVDLTDTQSFNAFDRARTEQAEKLKAFLVTKLEAMAEQKPIYSLNGKGIKLSLASMAIKNIELASGRISITLTATTLLLTILTDILIFLSAVGILRFLLLTGPRHQGVMKHQG